MELDIDKLDFDHCEDEPIHIPESIQSYGYLFAINPDSGIVEVISENVQSLLQNEKPIIGSNFYDFLEDGELSFLQDTYKRAKERETRLPIKLKFKKTFVQNTADCSFYAVVYNSGDFTIVELEPTSEFRNTYTVQHYVKIYSTSIAPKFKAFASLDEMAQEIVDTIRYITGMERVVLYRFNDDASGKVIAESKCDEIDSYLGLYYPASDIPPQARELYRKNWVRLTPNVNLESSKLIPAPSAHTRKPLDLTNSLLRSLSPIHCQYIRNQGLVSSFSMSLVTYDDLWGLISCHSRTSNYIPQDVRLQCENLSQLFSWHLYAKEEELFLRRKQQADQYIESMLDKIAPNNPIIRIFEEHEEEILRLMDADGFIFFSDQEFTSIGVTPQLSVVRKIYKSVNLEHGKPFITNQIANTWKGKGKLNGIVGLMLIPVLEKRNHFTAWFRKEHVYDQKWAGAPQEKSVVGSKRERLMPRSSFEVNVKTITGTSKEFDKTDVDMASRFNRMFLAHALEVQDKMQKNMFDLEQQDRHKNEFLATLAHELRNPLAPISNGVSLLESTNSLELRQKVTSTIKRQVTYMTKLIDDLMDVARITQGKVNLEIKTIAIQEAITNAVEIVESLVADKNHSLILDMPEQTIHVDGDSARLSQIFSNIINNAVKYTPRNGTIKISVSQRNGHVSVSIQDNGLGIPSEKLEDIFSMFMQVEAHSTHTKGGLGIGLTLVERLVHLHDGEIIARSEGIDKGSEFEVILPCVDNQSQNAPKDKSLTGTVKAQKVLVVDDNIDLIEVLEVLLQNSGHLTKTASNGSDAIEIFKEFKPDFAVLDIGLPDIDGYELCKILQSLPGGENTVFFSQSGWGNKEYTDKALEVGFTQHFVKPVEYSVLEDAFNKYIARGVVGDQL